MVANRTQTDFTDDSDEPTESDGEAAPTLDIGAQLLRELAALRAFAEHLVAAKVEETGLRARFLGRRVRRAILIEVLMLVTAGACLIYFLSGVNLGLVQLLGSPWQGHIATGAIGLFLLLATSWLIQALRDRARQRRREAAYEQRRATQRAQTGRDVDDAEKRAA